MSKNAVSVDEAVASQVGSYPIAVDDQQLTLRDPLPTGRQLLLAVGRVPADEHVLIQILRPGTKSIGLDEQIDLREPGRETFRSFKSDRVFLFTVDGVGYEWGAASVQEGELRYLARVPEDRILLVERTDQEDHQLATGEELVLAHAGTERLRTASRLVKVLLDDEIEKLIPRGNHTTEELIDLLGVRPGYLLAVLDHNGQLRTLQPGQTTHVREGMKFYSQAPGGGAS